MPEAPAPSPERTSSSGLAGLAGIAFFLARRGLFESRLTTALLVGAVAAGTGLQIPNAANMLGYKAELLDEGVTAWLGDVRVRPLKDPAFQDGEALAEKLKSYPGVRLSLPYLGLPGAVGKNGRFLGALVMGVPTDATTLPFRLLRGELPGKGDSEGIVLGGTIARRLGVDVGDKVQLRVVLSTLPTPFPEESIGRYSVNIKGIAGGSFGSMETIFADRSFLAEEAGTPSAATIIILHTDSHSNAKPIAATIGADLPDAQVRAWMDDGAYLINALNATDAVATVSHVTVVAAVSIPVLALLSMSVLHRRREVGVLSAVGFGQAEIFLAFLLQALIVGLLGVAIGCGIGYALVRFFQSYPLFEWESFVIRPVLSIECFLRPSIVVLLATVIAGVYPAWRAARVDPARVLRGIQ
jgi:lipoprotein-releasing system permease protein